MTTLEEFRKAVELISSCEATIKCGCQISSEEEIYADFLYNKCKKYMAAYAERARAI